MRQFIEVLGDIDFLRVTLRHGELFRQTQLDEGNAPATVSKKARALKRLFQLAVGRKQLEEHPVRSLKPLKWRKGNVEVYKSDECERLMRVARQERGSFPWDLLVYTVLITGMRRAELLDMVWADVNFKAQEIHVTPKQDTAETCDGSSRIPIARTYP